VATTAAYAMHAWSPTRRLVGLAMLGAAGAVAATLTAADLGDGPARHAELWAAFKGLVVASYVAVGMYTWWHRPGSRFGLYLSGIGLLYAIASLSASGDALAHTAGRAALAVFVVCLAYVLLCFPHDRLSSQGERRLVGGVALMTVLLWLLALPLLEKLPSGGPLTDCGGSRCPENAFHLVSPSEALADGIGLAVNGAIAVALLGLVAALVAKARSPARLRRRLIVPVLCSSIVLTLSYVLFTVLRDAGVQGTSGLKIVGAMAALAIPLAVLVGQVRGRMFATASVGELVARFGARRVTPAHVQALLRDALGDPLLTLALWEPARRRYIDGRGRALALGTARPGVQVTFVSRDDRPAAALIHNAALDVDSEITEALVATSLMLLENARLVDELRASRSRIVAAAQQERVRLERDLHDGAQQRLFALQLRLHAARAQAGDGELASELAEAAGDAAAAVEELRNLAHGLYPTLLRERGIAEGLGSAARVAAVPVTVVDHCDGRCPTRIEEAVYFCALEAIQNAAKHAGGHVRVTVTLGRRGTNLEFSIADDGAGFRADDQPDGFGILNMRDRIGAVGGDLEVVSQPGVGTTVHGTVPGCWSAEEPPEPAADAAV
jgi:signal transduction histidine kinase